MTRKYFPFCFYVLVSVLCLGKPSLAYPAGSFGRDLLIPTGATTSETDSITPLKIGDKIPNELWNYTFRVVSPHADNVQYLSLGDFRDKLIILDFWGSTCGPCIGSLNKLDSIQPSFVDDVFILPINVDDSEEVTQESMAWRGWTLPSVVEDLTLKGYFPHYALPHQVWIKDNKVYAIPPAAYATAENFRQVINEGSVKFTEKATVQLDKTKPLSNYEQARDEIIYQSIFTRRLPELVEMGYEDEVRWLNINMSVEALFQIAYEHELDGQFSFRIVWDLPDTVENILRRGVRHWTGNYEEDKHYEKWQNEHTFSYGLEKHGISGPMAREVMQNELNTLVRKLYGVEGSIIQEKVEHLVIRRTNRRNLLESKEQSTAFNIRTAPYQIQNRRIATLPLLIRKVRSDLPIKDMTGYPRNMKIDISLSEKITADMVAANKELKKYGLEISVEEIVLDKLKISQIK